MGRDENDWLSAIGDVSPVSSSPPKGSKEQRQETRYLASWRVAICVDGRDPHYGRVKDISLCGAAILNEVNIRPGTRLTLNILLPTLDRAREPRVLTVHCMAVYTAYDADHLCFRVGVSFTRYEQAPDRAYLEKRLTNYHVAVPDNANRRSVNG